MALLPIRTILQGNPISPSHQTPPDEFASYLEDKEARLDALESEGLPARTSSLETSVAALEAEDLPDRVQTLEEGQAGGFVAAATWTGLLAITPSVDGTAGEVLDSDTGTHSAASGTGYDGTAVDNAGRYSWNDSWGRWVRIGDTGLSAKADSADLAPVAFSGGYADLTDRPTLGTAAAEDSTAFASAAQGVLAQSAVQPAAILGIGADLVYLEGRGVADTVTLSADGYALAARLDGRLLELPTDYVVSLQENDLLPVYVEGKGFVSQVTLALDGVAVEAVTRRGRERFGTEIPNRANIPPAPYGPVFDDRGVIYLWLFTGQSGAVGSRGVPLYPYMPLHAPKRALMLNGGVNRQGEFENVNTRLVTCSERVEHEPDPADLIRGETFATGFVDMMTRLTGGTHMAIVSGAGSTTYEGLKKGSTVYASLIDGVTQAVALAVAGKLPDLIPREVVVAGTLVIHGESDSGAGTPDYFAKGLEWQADIEADARAVTGQEAPVPFYWLQVSSFGTAGDSTPVLDMLRLHDEHDRHVLCAPGYQFDYVDGVHHSSRGRRAGAEILAHSVCEHAARGSFEPARLARRGTLSADGLTVTVPLLGGVAFEFEENPDNPLRETPHGFSFSDSSGEIALASLRLIDGPAVEGRLASPSTGRQPRLWAARRNAAGVYGGSRAATDLRTVGTGLPSLYARDGLLHRYLVHGYADLAGGRQAGQQIFDQLCPVIGLDASALALDEGAAVTDWRPVSGIAGLSATGGGYLAPDPPALTLTGAHPAVMFRQQALASDLIDLSEDATLILGLRPLSTRSGVVLDARTGSVPGLLLLANASSGQLEALVSGWPATPLCPLDQWSAVALQCISHQGAEFMRITLAGGAGTVVNNGYLPLPAETGRRLVLGAEQPALAGTYAQADFDLSHFLWADKEASEEEVAVILAHLAHELDL